MPRTDESLEGKRCENMQPRRKVFVTGLGLITPLGENVSQSWKNLISPQSGIEFWKPNDATDVEQQQSYLGVGRVKPFDSNMVELKKRLIHKNPKAMENRFILFSLLAAEEALTSSGLTIQDFQAIDHHVAVVIGCGMGAATSEIPLALTSTKKISPYFIPRLLPNMAAGNVSIKYGFNGPVLSPATACASGAHAILDAARLIERGDVEVAVCGGTESTIDYLAGVGFGRLKALSTNQNCPPEKMPRPFDESRDGFVLGEGAGCLILESEEHYQRRSSKKQQFARFAGGGMSGDAFHITSPSPDGKGAELCMRRALKDAGIPANLIDYVNAHATSTPMGDTIEANAIARVLASNNEKRVKVSSTKGATGHLLGAAGAVEACFTVLSLSNSIIPPTINVEKLDPKLPLDQVDFVVNKSLEIPNYKYAMSNSFGFGGTNCSLIFAKV
jgi:3-oxoacyl-[acyl-carrier-protein] synthase II